MKDLPEGVSRYVTQYGDHTPLNENGDDCGYKWPRFGDRVRVKITFGKYRGKWLKGVVVKDCRNESIIASPMGSYGVYVMFDEFIRGKRPKYAYHVTGSAGDELEDVWEAHCVWIGRANGNLKLGWKKW